jgi:hypothetical protein
LQLTTEQVKELSNDPQTISRAFGIIARGEWLEIGRSTRAIWGHAKAYMSISPYFAMIDLQNIAYKCTCPVKRQPCKHTLSLLLQLADPQTNVPTQNPPPEVSAWIDKRDKKAIPKTKEQIEKSAISKEQNKSDRLYLMRSGIEELRLRIGDLVHNGITQLYDNPILIDEFAARMVDAKLGGIAKQIRLLKSKMQSDDWTNVLLSHISFWQIAIKMSEQFEVLKEGLQADLLQFFGYNYKKEDLMALPCHRDLWIVLGTAEKDEGERIKSRKTYLKSSNGNTISMLLEFVFGNIGFETMLQTGNIIEAEIIYYPSAFPTRLMIKNYTIIDKKTTYISGQPNWKTLAADFIEKAIFNPLLQEYFYVLNEVVIRNENDVFVVTDAMHKKLKIEIAAKDAWIGIGLSAIGPISIFGIWRGNSYEIISFMIENKIIQLAN